MSTFKTIRRELTLEFKVTTTAKVPSFNGTRFAPNRVDARVVDGRIVSLTLERLDGNGWIDEDPDGPDGAVLSVSYAGSEIGDNGRTDLPKVAQDALAEIEKAI